MKKHTKGKNQKLEMKNKGRGRTLASLLLVVMLTLEYICAGTVQASAATQSSDTCSHKWVTEFGNVGHIDYTSYHVNCGCGEGPMSFNGYLRHILETNCRFNWWGGGKKYGYSLQWNMDDYKVCSICGERKITKPKNPDTNSLGELNEKEIIAGSLCYKVTGLYPERTVMVSEVNYSSTKKRTTITVPDTIKSQIRIRYGNVREKETLKVTAIGANAFKCGEEIRTINIGENVTAIKKNAFKEATGVKKLVIKSTKLTSKSIADKAFSGLSKKAVITVPKSKLAAYKKLFKQKGFKGKVKAGTWKEKKDPSPSATKTPDSSVELNPVLVEKIDILDSYLVEWTKDVWIECGFKPDSKDFRGGVEGDISNTMAAIFAWMDDDIVLEVSRELGGSYTIKEFLEAYCKKAYCKEDLTNYYNVYRIIVYAANILKEKDCLIFG